MKETIEKREGGKLISYTISNDLIGKDGVEDNSPCKITINGKNYPEIPVLSTTKLRMKFTLEWTPDAPCQDWEGQFCLTQEVTTVDGEKIVSHWYKGIYEALDLIHNLVRTNFEEHNEKQEGK